ncbi:hypothetical protein ZIOFF_074816 [Zingiber officinale]|uniref:Uncharacterized protein n=1 Tax=Zingiber officinale TaxID=94328 RepID=A0A8J5BU13_ZINOF|nr:hypothetical protein ZIOFF_074816 [Zingiber officinale]
MDGVAGRLGRSSTRYGPTSVFSGPVRRWNKKWVALSNPDHRRRSSISGGRHSSRILLYRWTPVAALAKDDATPPPEEPPRRKFRYVPELETISKIHSDTKKKYGTLIMLKESVANFVAMDTLPTTQTLEEDVADSHSVILFGIGDFSLVFQLNLVYRHFLTFGMIFSFIKLAVIRERKEESLPKSNSSPKLNVTEGFPRKSQIDPFDTNPDMNNVSAEIKVSSKDQTFSGLGNGADLDLSLGLRAPDGDHEDESKTTRRGEGYTKSVRAASSTRDTEMKVTKSVAQNKLKRKAISPDLEMAV